MALGFSLLIANLMENLVKTKEGNTLGSAEPEGETEDFSHPLPSPSLRAACFLFSQILSIMASLVARVQCGLYDPCLFVFTFLCNSFPLCEIINIDLLSHWICGTLLSGISVFSIFLFFFFVINLILHSCLVLITWLLAQAPTGGSNFTVSHFIFANSLKILREIM